jgi:hypothetical protein
MRDVVGWALVRPRETNGCPLSSSVDQLREGVGAAEWQALVAGLSEDKLHELSQLWLGLADSPAVRGALVREVIDVALEYGERALVVALSRVSWENYDAVIRRDRMGS